MEKKNNEQIFDDFLKLSEMFGFNIVEFNDKQYIYDGTVNVIVSRDRYEANLRWTVRIHNGRRIQHTDVMRLIGKGIHTTAKYIRENLKLIIARYTKRFDYQHYVNELLTRLKKALEQRTMQGSIAIRTNCNEIYVTTTDGKVTVYTNWHQIIFNPGITIGFGPNVDTIPPQDAARQIMDHVAAENMDLLYIHACSNALRILKDIPVNRLNLIFRN